MKMSHCIKIHFLLCHLFIRSCRIKTPDSFRHRRTASLSCSHSHTPVLKCRCVVLKQDFYIYSKMNRATTIAQAAVHPTHHRCGSISNLFVLQVSQFTQDFSSRVLHFQQLQDGCSIVGDGHVLQVKYGDEHLILIQYVKRQCCLLYLRLCRPPTSCQGQLVQGSS